MTLRTKKDIFLSNSVNKQNFIDVLCEKLEDDNVKTLKTLICSLPKQESTVLSQVVPI
jgi:hypothetical protein